MNGKKSIIISHAAFAAVFAVFIAVGTFFDRDISQTLYKPLDPFFLTVTIVGQWLPIAGFMFFDGVLFRQALSYGDVNSSKRKIYCGICLYLAFSTGSISSAALMHPECLLALETVRELPKLPVEAAAFLLLMVPVFCAGCAVGPKEYDKELVGRLIRLLIVITAVLISIELIKRNFARPRFRTTLNFDGVSYLPWYRASGDSNQLAERFGAEVNDFRSFPSGHAVMSMESLFIFPALAWVSPKLSGKKTALFFAGYVYALLVMLSRIVLGAHFLSDVSFGGLTASVVSAAYYLNEYRISRKKHTENDTE